MVNIINIPVIIFLKNLKIFILKILTKTLQKSTMTLIFGAITSYYNTFAIVSTGGGT